MTDFKFDFLSYASWFPYPFELSNCVNLICWFDYRNYDDGDQNTDEVHAEIGDSISVDEGNALVIFHKDQKY